MLINVLIRTHQRPKGFKRALQSVLNQTHKDIRIIVSYDTHADLHYIPDNIEKIKVVRGSGSYYYDAYCNDLKSMVNDGYFFFLDDDDYLLNPKILETIIPKLKPEGLLVQLKRGSMIYPATGLIESGKIGMPCLILHHSLKDLSIIPSTGQGDYYWIKDIASKIDLKFEPIILVHSDRRGNGKRER